MRGHIALQKHSVRNMEALFLVSRQLWECVRVLAPLLLAWLEPATNSVQCAVETHFQPLVRWQFEFLGRCPKLNMKARLWRYTSPLPNGDLALNHDGTTN